MVLSPGAAGVGFPDPGGGHALRPRLFMSCPEIREGHRSSASHTSSQAAALRDESHVGRLGQNNAIVWGGSAWEKASPALTASHLAREPVIDAVAWL